MGADVTARYALVPVEATPAMLRQTRSGKISYDYMLAASPGADLLARIVRARDKVHETKKSRASEACDVSEATGELLEILDELGG